MNSDRIDSQLDNKWHRALNTFNYHRKPFETWMYEAKRAADELHRLALLFKMEREGKLPAVHHQCSHDETGEAVPDNHLTCCMGVECRACPFLLAFDAIDAPAEQIDQIKAWTCITHILQGTGSDTQSFDTSEGYIKTTDDMMYWRNLYSSLAGMADDEDTDE